MAQISVGQLCVLCVLIFISKLLQFNFTVPCVSSKKVEFYSRGILFLAPHFIYQEPGHSVLFYLDESTLEIS